MLPPQPTDHRLPLLFVNSEDKLGNQLLVRLEIPSGNTVSNVRCSNHERHLRQTNPRHQAQRGISHVMMA
jgi:hypothetical protein